MNDFYGYSFGDTLLIDRWKYKGIGRPKKTDYINLKGLQKKVNLELNKFIDKKHYA